MASKTSHLKSIALEMEGEARDHHRLLDDLDNDFDSTGGFLGNTMNRVVLMTQAGRANRYTDRGSLNTPNHLMFKMYCTRCHCHSRSAPTEMEHSKYVRSSFNAPQASDSLTAYMHVDQGLHGSTDRFHFWER